MINDAKMTNLSSSPKTAVDFFQKANYYTNQQGGGMTILDWVLSIASVAGLIVGWHFLKKGERRQ